MFIDTLMALWNIICRGRIRKMLVTSLGVGIGLICLLAFIVIPAFSRSSDLLSNMASSSDADQNANDVMLTQNHSRYEVTPPEVPPPSPTLLPTQGATTNNQPISGPAQSTLSVPPPPPFPPAFSNPAQKLGRHIIITIHRMPAQNENIIPPTPPANLPPPPAPPLMPPPSMLPPVTPTATAATAATATVTATATVLPTPQATATTAPLTPTPSATSVPATPGPEPSITAAPTSRSSISAFWQHE